MGAARAHHHGLALPRASSGATSSAQAKADYAATANAVAAFEPLTMVCADAQDAAEARAALAGDVEVVELPIDDSWLRDSGPIFVLDDDGRRAGVHFGFNSWGGKFTPYDARRGRRRAARRPPRRPPLRGAVRARGRLGRRRRRGHAADHRAVPAAPQPQPGSMSREEIEQGLRDFLGVEHVVWLGQGLAEDRDTDGHVDLIAAFTAPGRGAAAEHAAGHAEQRAHGRQPLAPGRRGPGGGRLPDPARRSRSAARTSPWAT